MTLRPMGVGRYRAVYSLQSNNLFAKKILGSTMVALWPRGRTMRCILL